MKLVMAVCHVEKSEGVLIKLGESFSSRQNVTYKNKINKLFFTFIHSLCQLSLRMNAVK